MRLYLSDYQVIGAVFSPLTVDRTQKRHMGMYGRLLFPSGEEFIVTVIIKNGSQPYIIKVCSTENSRDAYRNMCRLLDIKSNAVENNTNNLRTLIRNRRVNITIWTALLITYIICSVYLGYHTIIDKSILFMFLFLLVAIGSTTLYAKRHSPFRSGLLNAEVTGFGNNI